MLDKRELNTFSLEADAGDIACWDNCGDARWQAEKRETERPKRGKL
jgi:hypothetical protein